MLNRYGKLIDFTEQNLDQRNAIRNEAKMQIEHINVSVCISKVYALLTLHLVGLRFKKLSVSKNRGARQMATHLDSKERDGKCHGGNERQR